MSDIDGDSPVHSLTVLIDLDQAALGVLLSTTNSPLADLLRGAPPPVMDIAQWLPALDLDQVSVEFGLKTGAMTAYAQVSDPPSTALRLVVVTAPLADGPADALACVFVDRAITFDHVPLFGSLLSHLALDDFVLSYATREFVASEVVLPAGAPALGAPVEAGFVVGLSLVSGGSKQNLSLASSGTTSQPNALLAGESHLPMAASVNQAAAWFSVGKSLGPLTIARIAVLADGGSMGFGLDASLDLGFLAVSLIGLSLTVPVGNQGGSTSVALDGLAVKLSAGPLTIAGSLDRTTTAEGVRYDGSVLIHFADFGVTAAGSYAVVQGHPSLFVFGELQGDIGGPPAFFVTGLAAGFGVNRSLRLPAPDQVRDFPLIAAAQGSGAGSTAQALASLASGGWVPPTIGEKWIAAGVTFTSFELVHGNALLVVQFGNDLNIALLGLAALALPTPAEGSVRIAYVELELEAVLSPAAGTFSLQADLTPASYLLDPDCKLTGGFAACFWFGPSPHAGDFVVSIGGYHRLFTPPAWYPQLSRLGFTWQLSQALQIAGECYFAVTPNCVMAGGRLAATFQAGPLKAWLTAQTDFIMFWHPLWFEADVSVSVGIALTVSLLVGHATLSIEVGAGVELWGPPVRGVAHVHCWFISFDISINGGTGAAPNSAGTLDTWDTFAASSLPTGHTAVTSSGPTASVAPAGICRSRATTGLREILSAATSEQIFVFPGGAVGLASESAVPFEQITVTGPISLAVPARPRPISVRPLGHRLISSTGGVCIRVWPGTSWTTADPLPAGLDTGAWDWTPVTGNLPAALWGAPLDVPSPAEDATVVTGLIGISGQAPPPTTTGSIDVDAAQVLTEELPHRDLPLPTGSAVDGSCPAAGADSRLDIAATLDDPTVLQTRGAVVAALVAAGLGGGLHPGSLPRLAAATRAALPDTPWLGPAGSTGPRSTIAPLARDVSPVVAAPTPVAAPRLAALRAVLRTGDVRISRWSGAAAVPATRRQSAIMAMDSGTRTVERQWLEAHTHRPEAPDGAGVALHPGSSGVWDVASTAEVALDFGAGAALWLVALDARNRLLHNAVLPSGPGGTWAPPAGTVRVAATALDSRAARNGVHSWSVLHQIASQTFLAENAVVRSQSAVPGLGRTRTREFAATTGRELAARNLTQSMHGVVVPGFLVAHFASAVRATVVALRPTPGGSPSPEIRGPHALLRSEERWRETTPLAVVAASSLDDGRYAWLYSMPDAIYETSQVVRAAPPPGWQLDAVYGLSTVDDHWAHPQRPGPLNGTKTAAAPVFLRWR